MQGPTVVGSLGIRPCSNLEAAGLLDFASTDDGAVNKKVNACIDLQSAVSDFTILTNDLDSRSRDLSRL